MIELRFKDSGDAYQAASEIADRLGISVRDYLLKCIAEGHRVLAIRTAVQFNDLDIPAFERRSSMAFDPEELETELKNIRLSKNATIIKKGK
jgi:hypothetical protein